MTTVLSRVPGPTGPLGADDRPRSGCAISWRQVEPRGTWQVDPAGLARYDRLVDDLVGLGVAPVVRLPHTELPEPVRARGGWADRDTAFRFAEFAHAVDRVLGDRVGVWITLDGRGADPLLAGPTFAAHHHVLLGHGLAAGALRASRHPGPARAVVVDGGERAGLVLGPVLTGAYPDDPAVAAAVWDVGRADDLAVIAQPVDLVAVRGGVLDPRVWSAPATGRVAVVEVAALDGDDAWTGTVGPRSST